MHVSVFRSVLAERLICIYAESRALSLWPALSRIKAQWLLGQARRKRRKTGNSFVRNKVQVSRIFVAAALSPLPAQLVSGDLVVTEPAVL